MSIESHLLVQKTEQPPQVAGKRWRYFSDRRILLMILLVGVGLRLISAFFQGDQVEPLPGIHDQLSYDGLARRVLDGHGFSFGEHHWPATRPDEPTAHWSYLYTLYLAAVYAVVGVHPLAARVIQAVLVGVLHSWLAWRVGGRIFGPVTGMIAAALSALYVYFFYYGGSLITESFYIVTILWTVDVALRLLDDRDAGRGAAPHSQSRWLLWLELGVAIGLTVLLRQIFLLFVPILCLWLVWQLVDPLRDLFTVRARPVWLGLCLTTVMIAALILPWTIRNYYAFGRLVPLNTNAGFAFFWGNHPIYGTNFPGILPADGPTYQELIPPELLPLSEAELDRALLREGIGFVAADPVRYVLLSISRTREYFKFWPSAESSLVSNVARVGSFGLLLPLMAVGVYLSIRHWRTRPAPQRAALILFYLFITFYTGIHLLTWTLIRYRLPVDAILLFFAAYTITCAISGRTSQSLTNR